MLSYLVPPKCVVGHERTFGGYPILPLAIDEMVTYFNTKTQVLVGDYAEVKVWLEFWRGWQPGRVWYLPGISPPNCELEHHGLTWVAIHYAKGIQRDNYADVKQCGNLVEPSTKQLQKTVRLSRLLLRQGQNKANS